jgi:hypothetical protein
MTCVPFRKDTTCDHGGRDFGRGRTTCIRQERSRRSLSGEGCGSFGCVLYTAPRVHAEAPAAPRVCERLPWRRADSTQRSRRIGFAADAERRAAEAGGLESSSAESRGSSSLHRPSVDGSKPAIYGQGKTGNLAAAETSEFYFVPSSVRKSVCTLVRQLRGPHLSTCA